MVEIGDIVSFAEVRAGEVVQERRSGGDALLKIESVSLESIGTYAGTTAGNVLNLETLEVEFVGRDAKVCWMGRMSVTLSGLRAHRGYSAVAVNKEEET